MPKGKEQCPMFEDDKIFKLESISDFFCLSYINLINVEFSQLTGRYHQSHTEG